MVEFGIGILQTEDWNPGTHLHVDRGRYIRPFNDAARNTLSAATHQTYLKTLPVGGADGWTYAFSGCPGNVNGDGASPFTASSDYNLINFQPAAPVLQSGVSCVVKPDGAPVQVWRQEFIDRMTVFRAGVRVMDLCGTQSDFLTARDPASAGSLSGMRRKCPSTLADPRTGAVYGWQSSSAWSIDEIAALSAVVSEIHVCLPPMLPDAEIITFLTAFTAFTRVWVELSNEAWNQTLGNAPFARYMRARTEDPGSDLTPPGHHYLVGMATYFTRQTLRVKNLIDQTWPGTTKYVAVMAWQSGHLDPFIAPSWNGGQPVSKECYDGLNEIGHIFIAAYFTTPSLAQDSTDVGYEDSVAHVLNRITEWRSHIDRRGVKLHLYECGQHYGPQYPTTEQTTAVTLGLWDTLLRGIHQRMDPEARAYIYGLVGAWAPGSCWGLLNDIETDNAKWLQVKTTIESIRLIQPVLP